MAIAFVAVIVRLVGRYFILRSAGADDFFAFLALIACTATIVCINIGRLARFLMQSLTEYHLGVKFGLGRHESDVGDKNRLGKVRIRGPTSRTNGRPEQRNRYN